MNLWTNLAYDEDVLEYGKLTDTCPQCGEVMDSKDKEQETHNGFFESIVLYYCCFCGYEEIDGWWEEGINE